MKNRPLLPVKLLLLVVVLGALLSLICGCSQPIEYGRVIEKEIRPAHTTTTTLSCRGISRTTISEHDTVHYVTIEYHDQQRKVAVPKFEYDAIDIGDWYSILHGIEGARNTLPNRDKPRMSCKEAINCELLREMFQHYNKQ